MCKESLVSLFLKIAVGWIAVGSSPSSAFGLKTHLWLGQQIINDVAPDCAVHLMGRSYDVSPELCRSIQEHPQHFLSGSLGPDIYPDLVTGQTITHPGIEGGWQTDQWLAHLYLSANASDALAFSAGYLTHAAEDTFAHSYVNMYAGDVFEVGDERRVELRHFILEKYIDAALPSELPDPAGLQVPAEFLRDSLIYNSAVSGQFAQSGFAAHLASMQQVRTSVRDITEEIERIEGFTAGLLSNIIAESAELSAKMVTFESQLEIAREALRVQEQVFATSQDAVNGAEQALTNFDEAIRVEESAANAARELANAQREIAAGAQQTVADLNNLAGQLNAEISNLAINLANTPELVTREVCEFITVNLPWPLSDIVKEVCRTVQEGNKAFADLSNAINGLRGQLLDVQAQISNATAAAASAEVAEAAALQETSIREAAAVYQRGQRDLANGAFDAARATLTAAEDATRQARNVVEDLEREAENLRRQLVDTASIREAITKSLDDMNILSGFFHNWSRGIDRAGTAYIEAGLTLSQNMLRGDSKALSIYNEWLTCHGSVFLAVPYQVGEGGCDVKTELQKLDEQLSSLLRDVLPGPLADLVDEIDKLKAKIKEELATVVEDAAVELVGVLTNQTTADFIELLMRPENADESRLNEAFATAEDADGKALLTFPKVSNLVREDLALENGVLDPSRFSALKHALTFAKLSLLQPEQMRELIQDATQSSQWDNVYPDSVQRYSVLFGALRSIDGNHQWQPFGLPYPRTAGPSEPEHPSERHFGYGPNDGSGFGFQLFQQEELREQVFYQLFPEPIAGAISNLPELENYEFPSCPKNPFPRSSDDGGQAVLEDTTCRAAETN